MRITSGEFRGTELLTPQTDQIRPTSDKARQAIFNSLLSGKHGFSLHGAAVLDGTCGTGAMGIEALSRGARFCQFVDSDQDSLALTKKNLEKIKIDKVRFNLTKSQLSSFQSELSFDLVCLDPPYGQNLLPEMVNHLLGFSGITKNTLFILEEDARTPVSIPLNIIDRRKYGATQIIYAKTPE